MVLQTDSHTPAEACPPPCVNTTNKLQPFGHRRGRKTSTRPVRFAQLAEPVLPLLRARGGVLDAHLGDGHLGHVDQRVHSEFPGDRRHRHGRLQVTGGHGHPEVDPPGAAEGAVHVRRFEEVADHHLGPGGPQRRRPLVLTADQGADRQPAVEEQVGDSPPDSAELPGGPGDEDRSRAFGTHACSPDDGRSTPARVLRAGRSWTVEADAVGHHALAPRHFELDDLLREDVVVGVRQLDQDVMRPGG